MSDDNETAEFAKPAERFSLQDLTNMDPEERMVYLRRAMFDGAGVPVAAFNSSI